MADTVEGPPGWTTQDVAYPCRLVRWSPPRGSSARAAVGFVDTYRARYDEPLMKTLFGTTRYVLMLSLDDPIEVVENGSGSVRAASLLVGPQTDPLATTMHGDHRGLHVELDPLASSHLLGIHGSDLLDGVVDAGAVIDGVWVAELLERLAGCRRPDRMVAVLEQALGVLADAGTSPDPLVAGLWRELVASRGRARIGELVERSGFSHRHVVARFRQVMGMAPKVAARLLRFEEAARLLAAGWGPSQVASSCGYTDQSHLTREAAALSGLTPRVLAARSPDGRTAWRRATSVLPRPEGPGNDRTLEVT